MRQYSAGYKGLGTEFRGPSELLKVHDLQERNGSDAVIRGWQYRSRYKTFFSFETAEHILLSKENMFRRFFFFSATVLGCGLEIVTADLTIRCS